MSLSLASGGPIIGNCKSRSYRLPGNSEGCELGTRCSTISDRDGRVRAFTLVEMLVVISIVSVLMAIVVPAIGLV
ncbi:MAG: prepilin-type N-terminal cleavage/methylation domain-containing protein, partial [Planctomycetota bacterium]